MGVVYRARQRALERTVALKVIATSIASEPEFRERFRRESLLAASIEHPNVVPVYEAGEWESRLFIAMRFVPGTDLATVLEDGPLEPQRAIDLAGQVAAALDAAHVRGLIHRDVKPGNVLVERHGGSSEHAYLTDFGLAKAAVGGDTGLTMSGAFVGTVDYVAPEQLRGERVDARTDVYSLGCMLFHMLAGRVPFPRDNQVAKIYAHLNDAPPQLPWTVDGSDALDVVVRRAVAKDPGDRYDSAGEFARAAREAVASPLPVTVPSGPPPPEPRTSPPRFKPWVIAHVVLYAPLFAAGYVLGKGVG
jgi:serine/threonine protein kinase